MIEKKPQIQIGKLICEARKVKGLTQKELASLMGITKATVSNLEADRYSPTLKTLQRAAEAMDLTLRVLLE